MLGRSSLLLILLLLSCSKKERPDIIFDNFESGTYKNWNKQGVAFGRPVSKDSISKEIKNIKGKFFAYSNKEGEGLSKGQGKLVSNPFTINRKYIHFWIGGGNHTTRQCVNLIINNKVVRVATGANDRTLRKNVWDVGDLEGQGAVIEVVDAMELEYQGASIPHILVDDITFSDYKHPTKQIFEDFENGTYNSWKVEGEAFEIPRNRTNVYYPITPNGFYGKFFAFSFGETHDTKVGKLTSEPFTINYDGIRFIIGGGGHAGLTCMNLLVNDSIVYSQTGQNDGQMRLHEWDVSSFKGENAVIEIVDNYSGGWGHIMVDDIIFFNKPVGFTIWRYLAFVVFILVVSYILSKGIIFPLKKREKASQAELQKLDNLKQALKNSEIFKESNPEMKEVVRVTSTKETEINELFEKVEETTLTNYLNFLRVEEFKKLLKDPKNEAYTMMYLAEKSGFNSKSSFYRVFKSVTSLTPSQYKNGLG
ncbi:AraC family transcriptional regulator [Cytophaga sp. FL35]|uniref:helix-turn-helix domain-containing protein n=1 Tax=Cytophaga sp. FL35 TaxID=1904456 RepID=UPI0016536686|nr:AraC family transcriptional regulator [Cytophaga sp. FL35]MBC6999826.1 helix-turn-helix transcriptional regulator [Cytophaga sp. FL35]